MATVLVYYKNGNVEEFSSTILPFGDGYLLQNDFIRVDDIENKGVLWERSFFATEQEDKEGLGATIRTFQIVAPYTLNTIDSIFVNSSQVFPLENSEENE